MVDQGIRRNCLHPIRHVSHKTRWRMDGDKIPGSGACGIPAGKGTKVLRITATGRAVGVVGIDDETEVHRCWCRAKFGCAFQDLALRVAAANTRTETRGNGETSPCCGGVCSLSAWCNSVG